MKKVVKYLILIFFISCNFDNIDSSLVKFKAYQEGTQNFSHIYFLKDKTFNLESSSFFTTRTANGNWIKRKDTLYLIFETSIPFNISDTNLIFKNYIVPIGQVQLADSLHVLRVC